MALALALALAPRSHCPRFFFAVQAARAAYRPGCSLAVHLQSVPSGSLGLGSRADPLSKKEAGAAPRRWYKS